MSAHRHPFRDRNGSSVIAFLTSARDQARALAHRAGSELVRTRRAQITLAAVVALLVSVVTGTVLTSARAHERRWAASVPVVVTVRDLPAGHRLDPGDTETVALPPALAPVDAVAELAMGDTVRIDVAARTPLTRSILRDATTGDGIPRGWRAVAMPSDIPTPRLQPGDAVDVVAGDRVVATGGIVASLAPVTVAVPAEVAAIVAAAARTGDISLISGG